MILTLSLTAFVSIPPVVYAKSLGGKVLIQPTSKEPKNSQTMGLLEGYTNTNPTGVGGPELAIVSKTTIEAISDDGGAFVELGNSGHGEISTYVVREGDTLSGIAEMFGVSTNTILWANDISNGKIVPGQELVILPVSGVKHVVKKGDTLKAIVKKYGAELDETLVYNGLSTEANLVVGDTIIVPYGEIKAGSSARTLATPKSGYYVRPIAGGRKSQGIHGHNAVDIAASIGTPIVASASGKVVVSRSGGYNGGYGTYVVVSHPNGTQTVYGHMSKNYVKVGQQVSQGQVIGTVGNTGRSTGPHIHFEIRGARNPF